MKKICLAVLAATCLCIGTAAPIAAQGTIMIPWKIDQYDNGFMFYYCNGSTLWTNQDEPPGTFIRVYAEDPASC